MTVGLYVHADTGLHRLRPAVKLAALAAAGVGVFLVAEPLALAAALAAVALLYVLARAPIGETVRQLKPVALLLAVIFLVHGFFTTWTTGLVVVLRFSMLISLALLVTLTTRVSDMVETLERVLAPLAAVGVHPAKASLALSLALRFIPLIADKAREIREAQRARGLERSLVAVAVPLLVKTLKLAGDLTDAIEARGFDPDRSD